MLLHGGLFIGGREANFYIRYCGISIADCWFCVCACAHEQFCERNYCARSGEYLPFTLVEYPLQKLVVSPSLMACLVSSVTVVEACTRFIGKMKNICIHGER